ncbi:hypothetical protein J2T10_000684 [Paenarthrobacter nicotinovorans]|uniref:Uncharacterized protein n=1 Tax=Paenarthrobacter nicotinovorans TaxID=29320 RepID=A0ABT9THE1_PAENI|nr:hypothetical protein ANMWB30_29840 [Arthrobacter sp. MWB30]MDQ0101065.1 hypothetical protein [Paenarthrobacter nicotinovorans]
MTTAGTFEVRAVVVPSRRGSAGLKQGLTLGVVFCGQYA